MTPSQARCTRGWGLSSATRYLQTLQTRGGLGANQSTGWATLSRASPLRGCGAPTPHPGQGPGPPRTPQPEEAAPEKCRPKGRGPPSSPDGAPSTPGAGLQAGGWAPPAPPFRSIRGGMGWGVGPRTKARGAKPLGGRFAPPLGLRPRPAPQSATPGAYAKYTAQKGDFGGGAHPPNPIPPRKKPREKCRVPFPPSFSGGFC